MDLCPKLTHCCYFITNLKLCQNQKNFASIFHVLVDFSQQSCLCSCAGKSVEMPGIRLSEQFLSCDGFCVFTRTDNKGDAMVRRSSE